MNLLKYGRIGKAPFIKAIGIQQNHKKITYTEHQELDRIESGCFSCANYKDIDFLEYLPPEIQYQACSQCENCPNAVYKTVTKESVQYINEKNIYGYKPRLKAIALKLLLIYHFAYPDSNGLVRGLSFKELASMLNCTVKSVKNANNTLQKYGYIFLSEDPSSKKRFQVFLTEYKKYHLTAEQGGRGYATFNQESLMEFISMKDINQLRILLRAALDLDTNKNESREILLTKDYDSLRRFLPKYCKPGVIKKALSSVTSMFQVQFQDEFVHLKMNEPFHGRRSYEISSKKYEWRLKEYIGPIQEAIASVNRSLINKTRVKTKDLDFIKSAGFAHLQRSITGRMLYLPMAFSEREYMDLAVLSATYSFEQVIETLHYVYKNCINFQSQELNIGALVRTALRNNLKYEEIASLFNPA